MASPLSGVAITEIGQGYDLAIGYDNGTNIQMVGYTIQPGSQWQESTDIQDEQHLVQISQNQTDRYARYPKVSQGDWSGGERQTFFIDPTKYFQSDGSINVTVPGQLQLLAARQSTTFSGGTGGAANAATDGQNIWVAWNKSGVCNLVVGTTLNPSNFTQKTNASFTFSTDVIAGADFFNNSCLMSSNGVTHGIWRVDQNGNTVNQYCNDLPGSLLPTMAFFNGNVFYSSNGGSQLAFVPLNTPGGASSGLIAATIPAGSNAVIGCLVSTATNLIYLTSVLNSSFPSPYSTVWSFDGTTSTRLGIIPGTPIGGGNVNGIVYLIMNVPQDFTPQGFPNVFGGYVVYQVDGTSISIFDDYRAVDVQFQSKNQSAPGQALANVAGDGRYLYLSMPGFPVRAYDLLTPGNPILQYGTFIADTALIPSTASNISLLAGTNSSFTSIVQIQNDGAAQLNISDFGSTDFVFHPITLSYMDFGAPDDVKHLQKVFIDLATPLFDTATSITIGYRIDNQTTFTPLTVQVNPTTGNAFAYFPAGTKAARVQLQVSMRFSNGGFSSGLSPVIRSISVKATLGRSWTFSVVCDRNQRLRNQGTSAGEDTQGVSAQNKLANILNAYKQAGGDVTMFIPSPTSTTGVEQVQAVIQDYRYGTSTQVGPYSTEYGSFDMEGTIQLTVTETL